MSKLRLIGWSLCPLLASAALAASLLAPSATGCGGCYIDATVTDVRATPAPGCLAFTPSDVDACTGEYEITVQNDCAGALVVAEATAAPGRSLVLESSTAGESSADGTLDGAPISLEWTVIHHE